MSGEPFDEDRTESENIQVSGKSTGERRAYLVVVAGRTSVGKMYPLGSTVTVIGRGSGATVHLDEDSISRRHAEVKALPQGAFEVLDLGSRNGTWLNGQLIDRAVLKEGDKLQVGSNTVLKLSYHDDMEMAVQRSLFESTTIDPLTHLYNKRSLLESLERELRYAQRHAEPLSILMLDLDRFKQVNDQHGHLAGDRVLQSVARRVLDSVRCEDVVARYGGEELAIVLRGTPIQEALLVAERIRRTIDAEPIDTATGKVHVTVSIGVSSLEPGENQATPQTLIARADQALYRAKGRGRNAVEGPPHLGR